MTETLPPLPRTVLEITGADRVTFLQGLISNDISDLDGRLVYAALLSPQGKYLADFFLTARGDAILMDLHRDLAPKIAQRLRMYKLRADVAIAATDLAVGWGTGDAPEDALTDPRDPAMGWRHYAVTPLVTGTASDYDALRVAHVVPDTLVELIPDQSYILEMGFERLHGVDFKKGCYVGQEVTARMKHKTELRKGLVQVEIDGAAPVGTPIMAGEKEVGTLFTQSGDRALAYLRFDRAGGDMVAGGATVRWTA